MRVSLLLFITSTVGITNKLFVFHAKEEMLQTVFFTLKENKLYKSIRFFDLLPMNWTGTKPTFFAITLSLICFSPLNIQPLISMIAGS